MIEVLKVLFLFFGIHGTVINTYRVALKTVPFEVHIIGQAIGITGFIYLQWLM